MDIIGNIYYIYCIDTKRGVHTHAEIPDLISLDLTSKYAVGEKQVCDEHQQGVPPFVSLNLNQEKQNALMKRKGLN